MKASLLPAAVWLAGMAVPAYADDDLQCVASGGHFAIGQYACLATGGQSHLARCETNLNTPTWAQMLDTCPGGPSTTAAASFQCRVNGRYAPAGGFACLTISGRQRLARCDAELNNPSWTMVQDGCPGDPLPELAADPKGGSSLKDALSAPKRLFNRLMDRL